MDISIFTDKTAEPTQKDLQEQLASIYPLWEQIAESVRKKYPKPKEEWNYPGKNYGWSFRLKDKKRAIIYLLPRQGYFKVAFVFGQKATDQIMACDIDASIKEDLAGAKKYAEGRGLSIEVHNAKPINDIEKLIDIKIAN
ncbi:DUF3788 family protein [Labilibaculum sp. A4]|uniref:DUF3788 domain-containing protein n=1 Tax=Labilibaculum euxinus TaxID=2686357 RepID=UPI000F61C049|nr:DUF3788 domain-containing protein [Labilibaculum euxinus]MDQ1771917.1 DUF3788 domain-containing protein [Labilibaculum euxinus]MWN77822.1 DUF3788 family protein [Labilibaculum euxinus]